LDGDADLFLMNIMRFFEFDYVHDSSAAYLTIFTPNFKHVMQKKSLEALILGL
jgi:hypothetical protein